MELRSGYYPYRSEAIRDSFYSYYDSLAARQWPIASENIMAATSYGQTFVRIGGPMDAPPLVLLPGAMATSLMWAPNIVELSRECRTYAVDQVGEVGRTTCAKPARSMGDLADWLNELFDALKLKSGINLAGMSYGGAVTAHYSLRYPERLSHAILIAPGATVLRSSAEFLVRLIGIAIARKRGLTWFLRWIFADMARKDPQWIDDTQDLLLRAMKSVQHRELPFPPVLSDKEWGSVRVPTLFLVGEHETIYNPEKAVRRLKRLAPGVTTEVIAGAGHDLTVVARDVVSRRILTFVGEERRQEAEVRG